jgi:hypothetical protein
MEDTLVALNTGYWRTRDGAVIGRSRGKAYLTNSSWHQKLDEVVQRIEDIRRKFREAFGLDAMLLDLLRHPNSEDIFVRSVSGRRLEGQMERRFRGDRETRNDRRLQMPSILSLRRSAIPN